MLFNTALGDTEVGQQLVAHQVRGLAVGAADTQVDVGLTEKDGIELGVGIGNVHQGDIAGLGNVVQVGRALGSLFASTATGQHAGGTRNPH